MPKLNTKFNSIFRELKIELFIIIVALLVFSVNIKFKFIDYNELSDYFSDERLSDLSGLLTILVGIYIAIISILGTSSTNIGEKLAQLNRSSGLIILTVSGLIEALSLIVIQIFLIEYFQFLYFFFAVILILEFISFIKFIMFVILSYKLNLEVIKDSNGKEKADFLKRIESIESNIRNIYDKMEK